MKHAKFDLPLSLDEAGWLRDMLGSRPEPMTTGRRVYDRIASGIARMTMPGPVSRAKNEDGVAQQLRDQAAMVHGRAVE